MPPSTEDTEVKHYYFTSSLSPVIDSKLDRLKRKENITGRGKSVGQFLICFQHLLFMFSHTGQNGNSKEKSGYKKYPPCFDT